ncbi:MAG: methyltransferase domain-containing protein [Parabacteroides merdae]
MQKRHADRQLYFNEQSITTQKYVVPFTAKHKPITARFLTSLEIGCGERRKHKALSESRLPSDRHRHQRRPDCNRKKKSTAYIPTTRNLTLICEDIYKVTELHNKFDIIIIRDVIEHIPNQELFLPFIKKVLLKSSRYYFS